LHILFNNAGVGQPPLELLTADEYDLTWGVNCLGPAYFTLLLLPVLLRTSRDANATSPDTKVRVVTTSSITHRLSDVHYDTFRDGAARRKLGKDMLYSQSKRGNILFSLELARRYGDQGITSIAVNPGNCRSPIQRHFNPILRAFLNLFLHPIHLGALTSLWAGTSPETEHMNGSFLIPWARVGAALPEERDPAAGERLWAVIEEQIRESTERSVP